MLSTVEAHSLFSYGDHWRKLYATPKKRFFDQNIEVLPDG